MDAAASAGVFRQNFPLDYADADATGRLRLTALLNLLQSQAGAHSSALGFDYRTHRAEGIFWVLSRLSVEIQSWPLWPGSVQVDTWVRGSKAVYVLRDFGLADGEGTAIGRASSAWVLLKDKKPQRPEPWLQSHHLIEAQPPLALLPTALPPLDAAAHAQDRAEPLIRLTRRVHSNWEDIDMNAHVNNVSAVGWCLEQHDFPFLSHWRPAFLEVNFLSEMFADEEFILYREELIDPDRAPGRWFDYSIHRAADQTLTLRMRMRFVPAEDR